MKIVVGAIVLGVAVWVAAPWVSMARDGTIDSRTRAQSCHEYAVPMPRPAPDDFPTRDRSA
jgi:hypothetical protein